MRAEAPLGAAAESSLNGGTFEIKFCCEPKGSERANHVNFVGGEEWPVCQLHCVAGVPTISQYGDM